MKVWRHPLQVSHTDAGRQQPVQLEAHCVAVINLLEEVKVDCLHDCGTVAANPVGKVTEKARAATTLPQGRHRDWVTCSAPVHG